MSANPLKDLRVIGLRPVPRDIEPEKKMARRKPRRRGRWLDRIVLAALMLAIAPVVLLVLYHVVHAPSLPMIGRWLTLQPVDRQWVALSDVSRAAAAAVVAAEDTRFCLHSGVDWGALREVLEEADEEGPSRGASTLTMQLVKNLFFWPLPTYGRKALEMPYAMIANAILGKRRTLELYLNVVEWGNGIFGIQAAALHFFKKPARQIEPREAILLAAMLPNPTRRDPTRPTARHRILAQAVARRMNSGGLDLSCLKL